jgi:hypothetical protein
MCPMCMMGSMRNLEPITPHGVLVEEDVDYVVRKLAAGTYAADDLFDRYASVCRMRKHIPASRQAFGAALRRRGGVRRKVRDKSAWSF